MEFLGTKYQIYEGNKLKVFRLIKINKKSEMYSLKCGKEVRLVKFDDIKNRYIRLTPDASIGVMVTKDNIGKNVIINVNKAADLAANDNIPSIIINQDIYSQIKNIQVQNITATNKIYVSECYVKEIMGRDDTMLKNLLSYDKIFYSIDGLLYIEDTINDIIEILQSGMDEINSALKEIKKKRCTSNLFIGYFDNLKDLLNFNDFMINYRYIFNITQVEFVVDIGSNKTDDGEIILNNKQIKFIEDILRKYITDVHVIKYDKDIDVSKIVNNTHLMISDKMGDIYLISYIADGDYPVDNDIETAMLNNLKKK